MACMSLCLKERIQYEYYLLLTPLCMCTQCPGQVTMYMNYIVAYAPTAQPRHVLTR